MGRGLVAGYARIFAAANTGFDPKQSLSTNGNPAASARERYARCG
jgi:hypothetical protein